MRVELNLKKSDRPMNPWEISNFLNILGGKHYKLSLLNEIALYTNTNKNDIFIMDSSFSISTQYPYMSDKYLNLDNKENISRWYYLGVPIPFNRNNPLLNNIQRYFKIIRSINTELAASNISSINKNEIETIFMLVIKNSNSLDEIDNHIITLVSEKINSVITKTEKESNNLKNIFKKSKSIIFADENNLKDFFETFVNLERPVIGIYNKDTNSMKILCHYSISKNNVSKDKLDIKRIEHNSPTFMTILTSIVFISALIPCIQAAKLRNKTATSEEIEEINQKIMNEINELESIVESNNINKVSEINDPVIRETIENQQKKCYKEIETLLKNTQMLNNDFNVKILEN